jgi:DNA-directed RNA polymerase sigma subunit (sigma70/sigma32)
MSKSKLTGEALATEVIRLRNGMRTFREIGTILGITREEATKIYEAALAERNQPTTQDNHA